MKKKIENLLRYKLPGLFISLFYRKQSLQDSSGHSEHIVFLRPGKLGDMLVATPLFRAIKTELPQINITVVCSPYNHVIIENSQDLNNIKIVNFHSLPAMIAIFKWICKNKVDMVIDLTPGVSRTSTMLACFLRTAGIRIAGMHKAEFSRYFDITTDTPGLHIIDRNRVLLEKVLNYRFKSNDFHPHIYSNEKQISSAADFIKNFGTDKFIMGLNLSAGAKVRQWTFDNYLKLALMIRKQFSESVRVILFSHGEQNQWAGQIAVQTGFHIAPAVDFLTTAEILRFCGLLFTPDTAFLHLASAARIPVVALYCIAGENLIRWRAYDVTNRELVASQSGDVNEISAEDAFKEIKNIIEILGVDY